MMTGWSFVGRSVPQGLFLIGMAVFVLTACGGDDGASSVSEEAGETAAPSTDTIEVTMTDFAYEPASITVPAGQPVTLQFTNTGSAEHYFVVGDTVATNNDGFEHNLFRGVSIEKRKQTEGHEADGEEAHEDEEHHAHEFELPPGGRGSLTFTLPPEKAGTYTIACFETEGDQTHYAMGMEGTLTVTASAD